jgi:ABC-type sugar transport system permease subunit
MEVPVASRFQDRLYGGRAMVALTVGPVLLLFGVFVLVPALYALAVSLYSWTGFAPDARFVGLANYRGLFADNRFWKSIAHTLYYTAVGGTANLFFAFLFAVALHHPRLAGKKLFQTLLLFPSFISVVGVAILWGRLYDPDAGLLNRLLGALGLPDVVWLSDTHALHAIIAATVWAGVGGNMLSLLAGIRRIPPSYLHAARLDGAGEIQVFWPVTLPMLKPVAYVIVALWVISAMQVFGLVQALSGTGAPEALATMATYQYGVAFYTRDNLYMMGRGAAVAVVLVALVLAFVGLVRLAFGRREVEY